MKVLTGRSMRSDPVEAVAEATYGWTETPEILFLFSSSTRPPQAVAATLAARLPGVQMVGCTTAGEHHCGEHSNGSLVVAGLVDSGVRWATTTVRGLKDFDKARALQVTGRLYADLDVDLNRHFAPADFFCLLFIDGLSMMEERVSALLAEALEGVRLAGGSAGDDLAFEKTWVFHNGQASTDAATIVMGHAIKTEVEIVKHQHFVTTPTHLVITKAEPALRLVQEINGYPAAEAYAAALGLEVNELTSEITFLHPLTFCCDGEIYVRSILKINPDQSISFYCSIEKGMVLEIGGHTDMTKALAQQLDAEEGRADFVLGFNCILRALEAKQGGDHEALSEVIARNSCAMIGFDTYGEQLDGLHINQTLVAVLLRHQTGE